MRGGAEALAIHAADHVVEDIERRPLIAVQLLDEPLGGLFALTRLSVLEVERHLYGAVVTFGLAPAFGFLFFGDGNVVNPCCDAVLVALICSLVGNRGEVQCLQRDLCILHHVLCGRPAQGTASASLMSHTWQGC